jgi:hypothetical protein
MKKNVSIAVCIVQAVNFAFAAPAARADAPPCAGSACGVVSVTFSNGCYQVRNGDGSRKVLVAFAPAMNISSSISKELGPGEGWSPQLYGGACMTAFSGPYQANFR